MENLVVFTDEEYSLVQMVFERLKQVSPETLDEVTARIVDINRLSAIIDCFPSLFDVQEISHEVRTQETLIKSLLTYRTGDKMLYLPAKAVLGRGFLIAKYHAFAALTKIAYQAPFPLEECVKLRKATLTLMFTVMAEDVYLSLLEDLDIPMEFRRQIAYALLMLWEHRADQNIATVAPVLDAVWTARNTLVPSFGTMVGTSELLLLTIELDENWCNFVREKVGSSDVAMALEEFLFGLSYEQINTLKKEISINKKYAYSKEEVYSMFGEDADDKTEGYDTRKFYRLYSIRRDNARARTRLKLEGPHKTLEEYFISYILEKNGLKNLEENHTNFSF